MLSVREVTVNYGALIALDNVSIHFQKGCITAVLGHNGAGKSTLLKTAIGDHPLKSGRVLLDGVNVLPLNVYENVRGGIGFVAQGRNVFEELTIDANLNVAGLDHGQRQLSRVHALFPQLQDRGQQVAGTLSGGQRQMLAVGMSLMTEPKLLLLDEPTTGLSPVLVQELFAAIVAAKEQLGLTVVVIEQNVRAVIRAADRVVILKSGRVALDLPVTEFDSNDLWRWF